MKFDKETIDKWNQISTIHLDNLVYDVIDLLKQNNKTSINVVDVGSNIGKFTKMIIDNGIQVNNAILIEPIEEFLNYSKEVLKRHFCYLNYGCLDKKTTGYKNIYINSDSDNLGTPTFYRGSADRPVKIVPLSVILELRQFTPDLIKLDCEGADYQILDDIFDFVNALAYKPLIVLEYSPNDAGYIPIVERFQAMGYRFHFTKTGNDILLIPKDYIETNLPIVSFNFPAKLKKMGTNSLTVCTALFDLDRGGLNNHLHRSFESYKSSLANIMDCDVPMVIYCELKLNNFVWEHRDAENTRVINKTLDELVAFFPFSKKIEEIRVSKDWLNLAGTGTIMEYLPLYNNVVMSKMFFLNDTAISNYFDTDNFLWIDGGLLSGEIIGFLNKKKYTNIFDDKFFILDRPYTCHRGDIHGFEINKFTEMCGHRVDFLNSGKMFGGSKASIDFVNKAYYRLLLESLSYDVMGTEENILTIINARYPEMFSKITVGEGKFFDDAIRDL